MTDEDSKKDSTFRPITKPDSQFGNIMHAKPEQTTEKPGPSKPEQKTEKPGLSVPPKLEGISEEFKKGYDEGYNEGYKDAKDGKPKRKFK